jgi:hypothetical protein
LSEWNANVLTTGKSNFDEKNIGRNPIVDCERNGERYNEKNGKE